MQARGIQKLTINEINELFAHLYGIVAGRTEIDSTIAAAITAIPVDETNDVRLEYVSAASIQLAGLPGTSGSITIYGSALDCLSSFPTVAPTDNLITATGEDSGGACAASTFYYVYASNASASYRPSDIALSTTAPTAGYLGTTGNALNWKLVGWVRTTAATGFAFSDTQRLVCSKWNPRFLRAYVTESTSHTYATGTWRKWNNADATKIEFITHEDHLSAVFAVSAYIASAAMVAGYVGVGVDSTSTLISPATPGGFADAGHAAAGVLGAAHAHLLAAGYHYAHVLEYGAITITFDDGTLSIGLFL